MMRETFESVLLDLPTESQNYQLGLEISRTCESSAFNFDGVGITLVLPQFRRYTPPTNAARLTALDDDVFFTRIGELQLTMDILQRRGLKKDIDVRECSEVGIVCFDMSPPTMPGFTGTARTATILVEY